MWGSLQGFFPRLSSKVMRLKVRLKVIIDELLEAVRSDKVRGKRE